MDSRLEHPRDGPGEETDIDGAGSHRSISDEPASRYPPLSVIFGLLSNERRRIIIRYLATGETTTTAGDLAVLIASIENDKPRDEITSRERKRVYVALTQDHLPKLDDAGVVDYDGDRKTLEPGRNYDKLLEYVENATTEESSDQHSSLVGAIGVCTVVVVVIGIEIGPLSALIAGLLAGGLLVSFVGVRRRETRTP